ncbi:gamma-taxilin isoform X1 [Melitaea cinxia]|uniref:gamma-taxilin isoform X1 n=1 Tax=Melitaea cinxia TaxID=113334 RepID=UPI001E271A07|nr:gamma-taxilin isoform X1 [Melitaea cinxia]
MEASQEEVVKESLENALAESNTEEKTPTPPPQDPPKKSKKDNRTKKDDKNVEQFMKSLNSVPTLDEKLSLVCKKYVQATEDNKKLQFYIKQSDKRYVLLSKEKEQMQHEYNKTILVKSKLENLCRELQKQNKAIKEESLLKIREEEERRKETQAKFQNTLSEITTLLQQNNEKNAKLRDDNISMTEKFKSVVQQYQLREQQVDKMAKQMALESQLSDAKLQKASLEYQAEKERILAEMEQLKVTLAQYRAKIMEHQSTEGSLREQLAVYMEKYNEFQNVLVKSKQLFRGFKEQMENMSKKIQKLEKESLSWKKRWETSQTALLDMCGERQASEERAAASNKHLLQMQSLCRTLQAERTALLNTLKEHNIERPPLPAPVPMPLPAPSPASDAKVDAMAANCAQLRQSLAHLQTQLDVLTNKNNNKEESPKPEKPKKSKSKKNKEKQAQKAQETAVKETEVNTSETPKEVESREVTEVDIKQDGTSDEKIDTKTMESLIQAINMANINICDLEIVNEDNVETDKAVLIEDVVDNAKPNEVALIESEVKSEVTSNENEVQREVTSNGNEVKSETISIENDVKSEVAEDEVQSEITLIENESRSEVTLNKNEVQSKVTSNGNEVRSEASNGNKIKSEVISIKNDVKTEVVLNENENEVTSEDEPKAVINESLDGKDKLIETPVSTES